MSGLNIYIQDLAIHVLGVDQQPVHVEDDVADGGVAVAWQTENLKVRKQLQQRITSKEVKLSVEI